MARDVHRSNLLYLLIDEVGDWTINVHKIISCLIQMSAPYSITVVMTISDACINVLEALDHVGLVGADAI